MITAAEKWIYALQLIVQQDYFMLVACENAEGRSNAQIQRRIHPKQDQYDRLDIKWLLFNRRCV